VARIAASEGSRRRPRYLPEAWAGMYKPVKRPVTLRLDADVLAWFQRAGRGYQTRINRALRKVMSEERRKARECELFRMSIWAAGFPRSTFKDKSRHARAGAAGGPTAGSEFPIFTPSILLFRLHG